MADRYWVGGAGNWSSTTKWSTTSGGASGASVPTSADNAIFNASSGVAGAHFVATVDVASTCANLTFTPVAAIGQTTLSLTAPLTIAGTFSTSGTAGNRRLLFSSTTLGLAINCSVAAVGSVSDVTCRDVYFIGAGAGWSGTRIGDAGGARGVTVDAPKTVYWNLSGSQNWSANGWAATSGGAPSTDYFPLPQDTAVFDNAGAATTVTIAADLTSLSAIDMSARSGAMTFVLSNACTVFGNVTLSSAITFTATAATTFGQRSGTQTLISAGKSFDDVIVNSFGGTLLLGGALATTNIATITLTSGGFDTAGYAVSASGFTASNNGYPKTVYFRNSTITLRTAAFFNSSDPLTSFDAGTSTIVSTSSSSLVASSVTTSGLSFWDLVVSGGAIGLDLIGQNTFNSVTIVAGATTPYQTVTLSDAQTIGTLTCSSTTATQRILFTSATQGTQETLTVGSFVGASDIDFRDINFAGAAAPLSGTRIGDGGNNTNITPATPKTVYWNLAGSQNWSASGWALTSGGTPAANNFPLIQDSAVFDDAGAAGTVTLDATYPVGNISFGARTSAMTFAVGTGLDFFVYGNWTGSAAVTMTGTSQIYFTGGQNATLISGGSVFTAQVLFQKLPGFGVTLGDALTASGSATSLLSGSFDAAGYNVTATAFSSTAGNARIVRMGSGTWTLSSSGSPWNTSGITLYAGTAEVVLSYSGTLARTMFFGTGTNALYKVTIGGTGVSSTSFSVTGSLTIGELASTKTTAHTIAFGTSGASIGKWAVTGTVGNVVTITGTTAIGLVGSRVSGVDYLALGTTPFGGYAEFYAGANSTGTGTGVILTAAPAAVTRYWVGGTGTWDRTTTTNWSASSGGAGGASVPTSVDTVIFNSASNATAYTVTLAAAINLRVGPLTINGPAAGSVTIAGTGILNCHGNVTIASTGVLRTGTGLTVLTGSTTGKTFSSGVLFTSGGGLTVNGVGCGWALGAAWSSAGFTLNNGSFDTAGYAFAFSNFTTTAGMATSLSWGASTLTNNATATAYVLNAATTLNAGTSTLNLTSAGSTFSSGGSPTYNNLTVSGVSIAFSGAFSVTNFTITGPAAIGIATLTFTADVAVTGTLTTTIATPVRRVLLASSTIGAKRTFTVNSWSGTTDLDFRDIAVAGTAAPISGTRLGDCGNNSGVTFSAAKSVYWKGATGANWSSTNWATTSGGTANVNNFPLAQDTVVFDMGTAGTAVYIDYAWNIGSIDTTARTSGFAIAANNTPMYLYGDVTFGLYGNFTYLVLAVWNFVGQKTQTLTLNANQFIPGSGVVINSPGNTVQLASAYDQTAVTGGGTFTLTAGTFDAATYNVSLRSFASSGTLTRTLNMGSGTWTLATNGTIWNVTSTGLTFNKGTADIVLSDTSTSARTFTGGGFGYNKLTIGGATGVSTLTISGDNTFTELASTKTVAHTISLTTTTQTVGAFTVTGTPGNVVSITGSSAASPSSLVITSGFASVTNLSITNSRAFPYNGSLYAGATSTNAGSSGWIFETGGALYVGAVSDAVTGADAISATLSLSSLIAESSTALDATAAASETASTVSETAVSNATPAASAGFLSAVAETVSAADVVATAAVFNGAVADTAAIVDSPSATPQYSRAVTDAAAANSDVSAVVPQVGNITEAATAADVTLVAASAFTAPITEAAAGVDTANAATQIGVQVSEAGIVADVASVAASTFNAPIAEGAGISDTNQGYLVLSTQVSETARASDTAVAYLILPARVAEGATAADAVSAAMRFAATIAETLLVDGTAVVAPSTFNVVVAEQVPISDSPNGYAVFPVQFSDGATVADMAGAAYLWNPIDDSQTANWQNVNNTQPTVWVGVDDDQTPGWTPVLN